MQSYLLLIGLTILSVFTACTKDDDQPNPALKEVPACFSGKILNQSVEFIADAQTFENLSAIWWSGENAFIDAGIETYNENYKKKGIYISSPWLESISEEQIKKIFCEGVKTFKPSDFGFTVTYHNGDDWYITNPGSQPENFIEVIENEETFSEGSAWKMRVKFKINCNLYQFGAPHEFAGTIENGVLLVYVHKN